MPEEILMRFNPTRLAVIKYYVIAIIMIGIWLELSLNIIPLALLKSLEPYSIYLLLLPLISVILIAIAEIKIRTNKYVITNYRIIGKKGILSTKETFVSWDKISSCTIEQSFLDKLAGVGDITIESTGGEEAPEIDIDKVSNVKKIKEIIDSNIQTSRRY